MKLWGYEMVESANKISKCDKFEILTLTVHKLGTKMKPV